MATDWDKLRYEFDLYRRTPRARRHAIIAGGAVVLLLTVLVVRALLPSLPRGQSESEARRRDAELRADPALQGPSEFAKALMSELRGEARFGTVQAIPVFGGEGQDSCVMIQGRVGSEADRTALAAIAAKVRPAVRIDWQVDVAPPEAGGG